MKSNNVLWHFIYIICMVYCIDVQTGLYYHYSVNEIN